MATYFSSFSGAEVKDNSSLVSMTSSSISKEMDRLSRIFHVCVLETVLLGYLFLCGCD